MLLSFLKQKLKCGDMVQWGLKVFMMKRVLIALLIGLFLPSFAHAVTFDVNTLQAVIGGNDLVQVEKAIIFDASR